MQKKNEIETEDDLDLFKKVKNGDLAARNILAEKHLELVKKITFNKNSRFRDLTANPLLYIDDILQEGYLGLLDALKKYDFNKHRVKFKTYANYRIIGAILDAKRASSFIPRTLIEDLGKILQAKKELEGILMTKPSIEDIAKRLNWTVAKVETIFIYAKYQSPFLSLNQSIKEIEEDDNNSILSNLISSAEKSPLNNLEEKELRERISLILNLLSKKEKICIELAFGFNGNEQHTLKNIGIRLKLSESRISQIVSKVLKKLQTDEKMIEILKEYFPSNYNYGSS